MLSINNCSFNYRRKGEPTIDHFNLRLETGGVYGLLGSNGAGKSTLFQLICGLLTPLSGEITLDGVSSRKRLPSTMREIFIVPEEIELPALSLAKFCNLYSPFYPRFSHDDLTHHLDTFGMSPDIRLNRLSMGQKKKAILSFAMACNTKVLLLDEPTNGLDIPGKSAFRKFIAESMSENRLIIISTHQVKDVSRILDQILIMDNRKVILNKSVGEILQKMKFIETGDSNVIDSAFYAEKGIAGAAAIIPNHDEDDSEINLELLYNFAISNPSKLNSLFI